MADRVSPLPDATAGPPPLALQSSDHRLARIAYLSPFSNPGNRYIDIQKALLRELGFAVEPLTLGCLRHLRHWREIFDRRNVIAVHWLETRPFLQRAPGHLFNWRGLLALAGYAALLLVARARTVYFIHNHHAHDTDGRARTLSAHFTRWIGALVDLRVVHDPAARERYAGVYLPHPLYRESPPALPRLTRTRPLFGILGSVRPYKGIVELLRVWPATSQLLIAGHADAIQSDRLRTAMTEHGLINCVQTHLRFLETQEFEALLDHIDVMVLPHQTQSMLVSGAFFEAVGRVPLLVARASPFTRWVADQLPGVLLYDDDCQLPDIVTAIETRWPDIGPATTAVQARQLFGTACCLAAYKKVFDPCN